MGAGIGSALGNTGYFSSLADGGGPGAFFGSLTTNTAGAIANAATRSALTGTNFGDNIVAAIPDVVGQAVGTALGRATNSAIDRARAAKAKADTPVEVEIDESTESEGLAQEYTEAVKGGYDAAQARRTNGLPEESFTLAQVDDAQDQGSDPEIESSIEQAIIEYLQEVQNKDSVQNNIEKQESIRRQEEVLNQYRQLNRDEINSSTGAAKQIFGLAAHLRFWLSDQDFKVFLHDTVAAAGEIAFEDPAFAATVGIILIDGKVDKGAAYNLGQTAVSVLETRGIKTQTWAGFFTKAGLSTAYQITGAGLDSAFQAYNELREAGIDVTSLPRDQIKAISLGIISESNFSYNIDSNILTADYLHVRPDTDEFRVIINIPIGDNSNE